MFLAVGRALLLLLLCIPIYRTRGFFFKAMVLEHVSLVRNTYVQYDSRTRMSCWVLQYVHFDLIHRF